MENGVDKKQQNGAQNGAPPTFVDQSHADLEDAAFMSPESKRKEKFDITKNVVIISCGFLFLFTAFKSLQILQSSMNSDKGLGLISLCVVYGALIISCMFIPPYMIGRLGCKWALVFSMISYVLYTVANYYVKYWTLIPASILVGLSAAPLWSSKCAYLTTSAIRYTELSKETQEAVVTRFFGIFFLILQSAHIWGNLISSMVLQQGVANNHTFRSDAADVCGARYCKPPPDLFNNGTNSSQSAKPERRFMITMLSIYFGIGAFAIIFIIVCLNRLTGKMSRKRDEETGFSLLIATAKHVWVDLKMKLIVPLTFFNGLEQAFIFGDFTAAFVTCSIGIHRIGFVMICFGVTDAAISFIIGKLSKYTGRLPIFVSGFLVHLTVIITMLIWKPDASLVWVFYVLAAMQGFCDAIWQTQINALYGCYFPVNQEAAFSNFRLWQSLGFMVAFAYGNYICINVKLYILLIVLVVGTALYLVAELVHYTNEKNSFEISKPNNELAQEPNIEMELAQTNRYHALESDEHFNKVEKV